ncbi:3'-5' exonuclease [Patescibacteria group bacterium]|nr:3'-5' exonuclease [Patescibacteria group bacterium]
MKFARDILILDIEATGIDPQKDFPLQIAAVLLDKDNLLEKKSFSSYIKHPFSQTTNDRIVRTLGIQKDDWMKSPGLRAVLKNFTDSFSYNVTLCSHNIVSINFLQESFRRAGLPNEFDYHIIELWTLGYMYLSKQNLKKMPTAQTIGDYLKIPQKKSDHNSMENCRYLAGIFRKLAALY